MLQPDTHATGVFNADARGVHYDFLKDRVPAWFNLASTQRQEELAGHEMHQLPSWYRAASPDAKAVLGDRHTRYRQALNTVDDRLGSISDIAEFAEKLLKDAIKKEFNLDLDVRNVYFARKYGTPRGRSDLYGLFTLEQENNSRLNYRYRGISLLEAALANFEPDEEQPLPCDDCHIITTFGAYDGEILPTFYAINSQAVAIAPHAFAKLCRTLDIGARYQKHLLAILHPADGVERRAMEQQLQEHHRQQLALSVEIAHLQFAANPRSGRVESGISADAYQMLKQVLADAPGLTLDGRRVTFHVLKAFGIELVGPLLLGPDRYKSDKVERLLVYIPNDPQQPLREYASSLLFMEDLRARLHSASYRRFFSRFIPQREQGKFFKQFNRLYQPSGTDDSTIDYPLKPEPGRLPLDEGSITGSLWEKMSFAAVGKIFSDARAVAVPTGDEDIKARNERLQSYLDAVVSFLNVAAFIVPGLGPIMLGEGADVELARLKQEHDSLTAQLEAWEFSGRGAHQRYIRPQRWDFGATIQDARSEARMRIMKCWRRQTPQLHASDGTPIGLELDLSGLNLPSLPDLDTDFSHVGSLKLSRMNLATSPEGFLARFQGVRWLDLSGNQLRELPPAVGEMPGLTRLYLQNNRIRLSPETARILSARVTLRALLINDNDLRISPDFSQITDMRTLNMAHSGLTAWPSGLAEQPLLDRIDLIGNQMTTIPASVISPPQERLAQSARVNSVTDASGNPWSEATLQQVREYGERLEQAGLASPNRPNRLVASVPLNASRVAARAVTHDAPFQRWSTGLSTEQAATRKAQWDDLRAQAGADGFFNVLRDLQAAGAGHEDLQRRVWEVIDSITENSDESESLREQMFEWAGRPACCDRAALSFSNLEIMTMVYKARLQAMDSIQGVALSTLSRGMFRLDEVEKVALNDIDQRRTAINNNPNLTAAQKAQRLHLLEEVEIRLAYRYGLKDRLQLPGQPSQVRFTALGDVTQAMLDAAYDKIVALDNSPEEFQALLSREFWQDYVTQKYRARFESQGRPYQEALAALHERFSDGSLTASAYDAQAKDLQARLVIEDAALIDALTRQEIAERLLPREPLQTLTDPAERPAFALALSEAQAIEFNGKQYFTTSMPDAGDGQHYLLRVQSPNNPFELVSSGIVAKPDVKGVWRRRGQVGGMRAGSSDDEFESASESMSVSPYTTAELRFMRQEAHFLTLENELGTYNRASNGKYPLRDFQGKPIRIKRLETQVKIESGETYSSAQIKPYIKFEGYENVGALYEEKLQWRTFTADDVKVPGEKALIGQSMVVANRRIVKGEVVGVYGGVVVPHGFSVGTESTFGMIVGYKFVPDAGSFRTESIYLVGDNILSRINTHFEYDASDKPVRQAPAGYNVESIAFKVEAEHATSRPGGRSEYLLSAVFATEDIPAGVELRVDYRYSEAAIKTKFP